MAPQTVGGAIRSVIVDDGYFNERVFADDAPAGCTFPYVVITDHLTTIPALTGDGNVMMLSRMTQVDVWEKLNGETPDARRRVYTALDGAKIVIDDTTIMRLHIQDSQRLVEQDTNNVHTAFTVAVSHDPAAL